MLTPEEEAKTASELRDTLPEELKVPELDRRTRQSPKDELTMAQRFIQENRKPGRKAKTELQLEATQREIRQDQFLTLLLQGVVWKDAAKICCIDQQTAKKWLYSKALRQRFQRCRDAIIDAQLTRVCGSVARAITTLENALDQADEWRDRINAAKELVNCLSRFHQMAGMDARLRELEFKLGAMNQAATLPVTAPMEDVGQTPARRVLELANEVNLSLPVVDENGKQAE